MITDFLRLNKETKMAYWQLILLVLIITVLAPITVNLVDNYINKEPTVEEIVEKGEVVVETMHTITDLYDASRMYIGRFYNGTFFTNGDPLARWVVTHQVTSSTVTNLPPEFTEFPVTFLADAFSRVSENGYIQFHLEDSNPKGVVYNIMRAEEMRTLYMFSVHNPNDEMIAVAVMEFRKAHNLTPEQLDEISTTIERLSGFIMYE